MLNNKTFKITALLALLITALLWAYPLNGDTNVKYKVQPNLSIGPRKSDTVRIAETYERMMDRYISTLEYRILNVDRGVEQIDDKLNRIESKIDTVNRRLLRIEKALNITEYIPNSSKKNETPEEKTKKTLNKQ